MPGGVVRPVQAEPGSSRLDRRPHSDTRAHLRRSCPSELHRDSVALPQAGVLLLLRQVFGNPGPSRSAREVVPDRPDSGRGDPAAPPRWPGAALESPAEPRVVPPRDMGTSSTPGLGHTMGRGRTTPGTSSTCARERDRVAPPAVGREVDSGHRQPHARCRDHAAPPAGRFGCARTARLISPQPQSALPPQLVFRRPSFRYGS
jgi:hypothetical protein